MSRFFLRDPPRRFDMIMMQLNLKYDDRGLIPAIVQ